MSLYSSLGFGFPALDRRANTHVEHILVRRPLRRVLAFLGYSIDDVCSDPIVKNQVICYFKLHKQIERTCEVTDLERQWNPTGAVR